MLWITGALRHLDELAGRAVLRRKARGPYLGLLDLPGGSPVPGESPEETLRRELIEERGVCVVALPGSRVARRARRRSDDRPSTWSAPCVWRSARVCPTRRTRT